MAEWRKRMGPATFRGVPFHVDTAEFAGGRRGVRHEYPLKDKPFREDMGRRARDFSIEGYVVGDDYLAKRDSLIAALEEPGPGDLVHPRYGNRRVACATFRVRESTAEGGMARFSIDFEETPDQAANPSSVPAAAEQVKASAAVARASIGKDFIAKFRPGTLMTSVADCVRAVTLSIDNAKATIAMSAAQSADLRTRLDRLSSTAASLVNDPDALLEEATALFDTFVFTTPLLSVADFDPGVRPPATTTTRAVEQSNWDAMVAMLRTMALARAAEVAPSEKFDSYDAAVAKRDAINGRLDDQAEGTSDDTFAALSQLRADLVRALPGEDADLPRLARHTPAGTVPSLVLAHRLYGNLDREEDIVRRNHVARPGFIVGGLELEVLSDE